MPQTCFIMAPKTGPKKVFSTFCVRGLDLEKHGLGTHKEKKVCRQSASWVQICAKHLRAATKPLRWLTPFFGPNMDPKMGSRIESHFQALGPRFGVDLDPKVGLLQNICGQTVASGLGTHKEKKVCVDSHVQAGSQICLQNICGQQRNSPMADPIFRSKYGPQNGVQN